MIPLIYPMQKFLCAKKLGKNTRTTLLRNEDEGWVINVVLKQQQENALKKKRGGGRADDEGNNELNEIISTLWFVSEKKTETFGTMERETDGCLLLDKNSITSINLLLSLIYLYSIINSNITA